jgi:aminopeptidase N
LRGGTEFATSRPFTKREEDPLAKTPQTIYLKDYQPPLYLIPSIDLDFALFANETFVTGKMLLKRNPKSKDSSSTLFLNGLGLELVEILRDGRPLEANQFKQTDSGLQLFDCPDNFYLQTKVRLEPHTNKAFSGLYKTKTVFCTQMEAQGFRRATFFLDRPDVLSKYRTTITADKAHYPVLLSNGNLVAEKDLEQGRHQAVWEDPFPKPCYLFALVAGDLDWIEDAYLTRSNRQVDLKIYVDKGKSDRARFAMDSLKQSMKWDEETYRLEYDLDIYNIVAVDDFNMGAMENKGLNIFNSKYVLASPATATDEEYMGIQRVIGHEYFHNWTGNRVTCRDWFQLSLKEGLTVFRDQEFSSDMGSRPVKRIEDVAMLRSRQFPEDSGPMAHPVRPPSYIAIDNFYTVTVYEKGAEVIRMLHTLLGSDMFKKGITKYFELYDGQAVTTDDWVHAMEVVSGRDLSQFKLWYDQAGTPEISVHTRYSENDQSFEIELKQKTIDPRTGDLNKAYHIPIKVGLVSPAGSSLDFTIDGQDSRQQTVVLELTEEQQTFELRDIGREPVLSLNREFSAPVQINFEQSDKDLYLLMTKDPDSFNRWESGQKLFRQTLLRFYSESGQLEAHRVPDDLLRALDDLINKGEDDPALTAKLLELPQTQFLSQFISEIHPLHLHQSYQSFYQQVSKSLHSTLSSSYQALAERKLGFSARDVALRTLKNTLLNYLYRHDETTGALLFYQQFENARNMTDRQAALTRLAATDSPEYDKAMREFRNQWHHDPLVLNKWFMVTALAKGESAFDKVKERFASTDFDKNNPNNIYALLFYFAQHNLLRFHDLERGPYQWLAEQIIDIDSRNPQVSSRLATCFNNWKRMAPEFRKGMQEALTHLQKAKLSNNLYEIVSRALRE